MEYIGVFFMLQIGLFFDPARADVEPVKVAAFEGFVQLEGEGLAFDPFGSP